VLMSREKPQVGTTHKGQSTNAAHRGGGIRSSDEAAVMAVERRDSPEVVRVARQPRKREERARQAKPNQIDKWEVWQAYQAVKANKGAAGVDGQSIQEFERDVKNNLYKLWNRMSSGSYQPAAVRRVEIPKGDGSVRPLGIPTVTDRIAQTVVKQRLEPIFEGMFHNNSYGYRPSKSAQDAVGMARIRCWERGWVVDVDIKGFFDNIDHDLLLKALKRHVPQRWQMLYIERWLKAEVQLPDGQRHSRGKGTPQGGVISPLLANVFLHYAFDRWVVREMRNNIRFERYADDIVCHCHSRQQAETLLSKLQERMRECGLELHPQKTKIVYCGQDDAILRREANVSFDFLGFTFRQRKVVREDQCTRGFLPAISAKASKAIRQTINAWDFRRNTPLSLKDLCEYWNPKIRGWMTYYAAKGRYGSRLYDVLKHFDYRLARWYAQKDRGHCSGRDLLYGHARIARLRRRHPDLFVHWSWGANAPQSGCTSGRAV
jgi:RNA-directed DNA polymerase